MGFPGTIVGAIAGGSLILCGLLSAEAGKQAQAPPQARSFHRVADAESTAAVTLELKEGDVASVVGTALTIEVKKVADFTAHGCLGGPVGCNDHVQLEVRRDLETQEVVLVRAHTAVQEAQHVDQAQVFGYRIELMSLHEKAVTLRIVGEN